MSTRYRNWSALVRDWVDLEAAALVRIEIRRQFAPLIDNLGDQLDLANEIVHGHHGQLSEFDANSVSQLIERIGRIVLDLQKLVEDTPRTSNENVTTSAQDGRQPLDAAHESGGFAVPGGVSQ